MDGFQLPPKDNSKSLTQGVEKAVRNACINLQGTSCNTTRPAKSVVLHAMLPVRVKQKGNTETVGDLVSKETVCCVGGKVKY